MSLRYKGAVLSATPPTVNADGFGSAKGIWTMQQQYQYEGSGTWPSPFTPAYVEDVFSTYLYTGNGTSSTSTQTITNDINLSTDGGMVWIKNRGGDFNHTIYDTARGVKKELYTNLTDGQLTRSTTGLTAFNTTGFTLTGDSDPFNTNNSNYAAWSFKKATKFFDVVAYTGNDASNRQISHNLGSVPGCIIVKCTSGGGNWAVYHRSVGNTKALYLNTTTTGVTASTFWNNTDPTSTNFTVGSGSAVNTNGETYIAYVFAHNAGGFGPNGTDSVVSCGSYTGNGSATGPTVELGWEPQWVLVKSTTASGSHWYLMDNTRGMGYNRAFEFYPNLTAADQAQTKNIVPTPTGFQVVTTDGYLNTSSGTYVYIAIRRGPQRTPTDATKVFAAVTGVSSSSPPYMVNTAPFTVDAQIMANRPGVENKYSASRLQGSGGILYTNLTNSEVTADYPAWDRQTGVGSNVGNSDFSNYITWNFKRAPGFFDAVCYTGTGANRTINHNLGVAPELIIVKSRSTTGNWAVYNSTIGATKYLRLNTTAAADTWSAMWNNTAPTSSVFTVGTDSDTNTSGTTYIAYLFATVPGVSKVGTYTGTGGTTNQIDCGFTNGARFVLIKRTDSTGNWTVFDTTRGIVSGNESVLFLNLTSAENTGLDLIDPYSAGFETSSTSSNVNASGATYIYLAIA